MGENQSGMYKKINQIVPILKEKTDGTSKSEFKIDKEKKQVFLTENGHVKMENLLLERNLIKKNTSLYDAENICLMHYIYSALKAHHIFKKNVDYIVKKIKL